MAEEERADLRFKAELLCEDTPVGLRDTVRELLVGQTVTVNPDPTGPDAYEVSIETVTSGNPLTPDAAVLVKIGSIARHAQEVLSGDGHHFDQAAIEGLLLDADVVEWMAGMDRLALLPVMRRT